MKSKDKRNETLELHTGPIQSYAEDTSANHTPSQDEIRLRAYEIHLERGDLPGNEFDDWKVATLEMDFIGAKPDFVLTGCVDLPGNEFDDWLQAERELERPAPKAERFSIKRASE